MIDLIRFGVHMDTDTAAVSAGLAALFPKSVAIRVWTGDEEPALFPEESAAVARAVPSRRIEFARGRYCARSALEALGASPVAIPVGKQREPLWPDGFVGSITHCDGLVAAVACRTADLSAIGVDAEPARPLPPEVRSAVLLPSESEAIVSPLGEVIVFSAKESIHKALFPSGRVWMDFLDVEVKLDAGVGHFAACAAPRARDADPRLGEMRGRFAVAAGFVLTACYLPAPERVR